MRGGSWASSSRFAKRGKVPSVRASSAIGFRVARDLRDRSLLLYEQGVAETKRLLNLADNDVERNAAFDYLKGFLEENEARLRSSDEALDSSLRGDVYTLKDFLEKLEHEVFDEEACGEYRNHVFYQFAVDEVEAYSLTGAPKVMLELYDIACE